jgi:hypothetical protein
MLNRRKKIEREEEELYRFVEPSHSNPFPSLPLGFVFVISFGMVGADIFIVIDNTNLCNPPVKS